MDRRVLGRERPEEAASGEAAHALPPLPLYRQMPSLEDPAAIGDTKVRELRW